MVRLIIDMYERDQLVLTHVFYGATQDEALAVYDAHYESDRYLAECTRLGNYGGDVPCEPRSRWEVSDPSGAFVPM